MAKDSRPIALNRKAYHAYYILQSLEAGLFSRGLKLSCSERGGQTCVMPAPNHHITQTSSITEGLHRQKCSLRMGTCGIY